MCCQRLASVMSPLLTHNNGQRQSHSTLDSSFKANVHPPQCNQASRAGACVPLQHSSSYKACNRPLVELGTAGAAPNRSQPPPAEACPCRLVMLLLTGADWSAPSMTAAALCTRSAHAGIQASDSDSKLHSAGVLVCAGALMGRDAACVSVCGWTRR
jgi:hypothetical protein